MKTSPLPPPEAPTDAELQAHLEELSARADSELASGDIATHRPAGFMLLPPEWKQYITDLEEMAASHDEEFTDALSGGATSRLKDMEARLSEKDQHILKLTDALEDHRKAMDAQEQADQEAAVVELKRLLGEDLWAKDPDAPAKLHSLLEGGMPGPDAVALLRDKAGLTKFVPKGAGAIPATKGSDGGASYLKRLRGE